jgi:hypothetical protein
MVAATRSRAGKGNGQAGLRVPAQGRPVHHWHNRVLYLARVVTFRECRPTRRPVTVGFWCPVCGFHPNATANEMQRVALEAVARTPAPKPTKSTS